MTKPPDNQEPLFLMSTALIPDAEEDVGLHLVAARPPTWRPRSQDDLAPAGAKAKARANLAALEVLTHLGDRLANEPEARILARWAGWGAVPDIFGEAKEWAAEREQLRHYLDDHAWAAARRTVLNAHYTSAEVITAVWKAVADLGFTGGRVLEPGCGSGNFIGLVPEDLGAEFVGVELDPTTARIAAALYPDADIRSEGFEDSLFPPSYFDLLVGNVPFANLALHDPTYNRARHSIHNHFIIKGLHLTRPGALVAVLTSRFTMDSRNPAARREIAGLADLVGAVRLPEGAFQAAAGTRAVIDVLILRRSDGSTAPNPTAWHGLASTETETGPVEINRWFVEHPHYVLGTLTRGRGMYRDDEPLVKAGEQPLGEALPAALGRITAEARRAGLTWAPPPRPARAVASAQPKPKAKKATKAAPLAFPPLPVPTAPPKEGSIVSVPGHGLARLTSGILEPYEVRPACDARELAHLVELRDTLMALLELQANDPDADLTPLQSALTARYDAYVDAFGPLNRFKLARTGRTNEDGTEKMRRIRPRMGGFRIHDPDFPALLALECFDPETQTATKAAIFTTRVVKPRERRRSATNPQDALSLCLDEYGEARLDVIAASLGVQEGEVRSLLGELVWENPTTDRLETVAAYLSGNVRKKLGEARLAAERDGRFFANVEALQAALPPDLGPADIDARLGAPWIGPDYVTAFLKELGANYAAVEHVPLTATWSVTDSRYERGSVALSSTWGTARADAVRLVQSSLNQTPHTVYDEISRPGGGTGKVINHEETLSAREKQAAVEDFFSEWVWKDPERATDLVRTYNERFNSIVPARYDGSHLSLPGLSDHLTPHAHQLNAIWRTICDPTVLLHHVVGAGKTLTMVAAAMELRRLGLVRSPVFVVPNHLLEQFVGEFIQHYPLARVLMATKEQTDKAHRKEFVARCATGDWDAVVMTMSAFERIPLSPETRARFIDERVATLRMVAAAASRDGARITVKRLEKMAAKLEARHERLMAEHRKDDGVSFEAAGFDYLFVDEAHYFKNMAIASHVQGVGGDGSQRAEDLDVKISYLRSRHGARVATFATATPVANTLAEMFVMQRYLDPEELHRAGIHEFDAWAATFARTVNELELAPDGSTWRIGSRLARFANVPELLRLYWRFADVRTAEDVNLPVPDLYGGAPEIVVVPRTPALAAYMDEIAKRAEDIREKRVTPDEDNMLKLSTDGRKAALHLRLVDRKPDGEHKVDVVARKVKAIHDAHRDVRFLDRGGNPASRPGAFQLVFCELGTPHDGQWSVYEELRAHLVALGMEPERVRFIHDAKSDRDKAELFAACRDGRVAVLLGSTPKMGVGTNVQDRMVALHHVDAPWRPADIEQREGRGVRQGNQNATLRVIRYTTENSFDTFMWQALARKATFIHQLFSGRNLEREIEDIGEQALSYAEVKALTTGNPLILEKAGVDTEVGRLDRQRRAHDEDQWRLRHIISTSEERIERTERTVVNLDTALARRVETKGDAFRMTVEDKTHTFRVAAGEHLLRILGDHTREIKAAIAADKRHTEQVATLGGQPLMATWKRGWSYGYDRTLWVPKTSVFLSVGDPGDSDPVGVLRSLEHQIQDLDKDRDRAVLELQATRDELAAAKERVGIPFPGRAELDRLARRQVEINTELTRIAEEQRKAKEARKSA